MLCHWSWHIGLPTATILASSGYEVVGVDINSSVVSTINEGGTYHKPDLDKAVANATSCGNLRASCKPEKADIFIIAVPTPFKLQIIPFRSQTLNMYSQQ